MDKPVIVFGQLTDLLGGEVHLMESPESAGDLRSLLTERFPELAGRQFSIAVDQTIANDDTRLSNSSTIALLPPFSGG